MKSKTTFICKLSNAEQKRISNALKDVLSELYNGNQERVQTLTDLAMQGRLCDIESLIDVDYYVKTNEIRQA